MGCRTAKRRRVSVMAPSYASSERKLRHILLILGVLWLPAPRADAQGPTGPAPAEFRARRDGLMARLPHEILVVRTSDLLADLTAPNRLPDPNFYYLTGLPNALGAVL